jgi:hypothetical protein
MSDTIKYGDITLISNYDPEIHQRFSMVDAVIHYLTKLDPVIDTEIQVPVFGLDENGHPCMSEWTSQKTPPSPEQLLDAFEAFKINQEVVDVSTRRQLTQTIEVFDQRFKQIEDNINAIAIEVRSITGGRPQQRLDRLNAAMADLENFLDGITSDESIKLVRAERRAGRIQSMIEEFNDNFPTGYESEFFDVSIRLEKIDSRVDSLNIDRVKNSEIQAALAQFMDAFNELAVFQHEMRTFVASLAPPTT